MVFGGLAIALFFVSLWFSELRFGEILTRQSKGVSRWEDPAKFRRAMIGQAIFLSILLAMMTIGAFKAYFGTKPEPHAGSEPHAEPAENAETGPHAESEPTESLEGRAPSRPERGSGEAEPPPSVAPPPATP